MTAREIAPLAGLTDPTVYKAMMPDSRLSVETWEKLESIVPPDFEPDTNQDAAA